MYGESINQNERLRLRAYTLWEEAGRPEGQAEVFWQKARKLLDAQTAFAEEKEPEPRISGLRAG